MAWFGESLANIKGQISSFTKEVLNADGESEEQNQTQIPTEDELNTLRDQYVSLQQLCQTRSSELEHFREQVLELQGKCDILENQNKSIGESYQNVIRIKDQENQLLRDQLLRLEAANKELQERNHQILPPDFTVTTAIDKPPKIFKDAFVNTHVTEERSPSDDSNLKDLEEQCESYQNDMLIMCEELMTLQERSRSWEESTSTLAAGILQTLQHDFILDGESVLGNINKSIDAKNAEEIVYKSLRKLAQFWKELVDKKSTLERTVSRFSVQQSQQEEMREDEINQFQPVQPEFAEKPSASSNFGPEAFFPKLDTFNLETIMEEEGRSEFELLEDETSAGGSGNVQRRKQTPSPAATASICSSTTSAQELLDEERFEVLTSAHNKHEEDQKQWEQRLAAKENQIQRLEFDLQRLRSHLVDLEEQSTSDALMYEEREKALKEQLEQIQRDFYRSKEEKDRSVDVREEITRLNIERDMLHAQNCSLEDQTQKLTTQLQNLHFVLEQFQKEKETEIIEIRKSLRLEMNYLIEQNDNLKKELEKETNLLEKAKSGLDAAQQLNAQIEEKSAAISHLKAQVSEKEEQLAKLKSQMESVAENLDGKIDRYLVKNMIVGYFATPPNKRVEVLRVIATVLDFNREDRQKTGLESSSVWPFARFGIDSSHSGDDNQSLSEAFIHFLETESQPKVELRIPTEEITTRRNSRAGATTAAAGMTSSPVHSSQESQDQRNPSPSFTGVSELSVSLPVLSQVDRSNSILKDVLNPQP